MRSLSSTVYEDANVKPPFGTSTGSSDSVVVDEESLGSGNVLQQQVGDFRIIFGFDGFIVYEFLLLSVGDIQNNLEGILVHNISRFGASNVMDLCFEGYVIKVALGHALGRIVNVLVWR